LREENVCPWFKKPITASKETGYGDCKLQVLNYSARLVLPVYLQKSQLNR